MSYILIIPDKTKKLYDDESWESNLSILQTKIKEYETSNEWHTKQEVATLKSGDLRAVLFVNDLKKTLTLRRP